MTARKAAQPRSAEPGVFGFFTVISAGPLIIVRAPMKGKRGSWTVAPRWSSFLRALTPVMQSHGMRKKDISAVDALAHPNEWDGDPDDFYFKRNQTLHRYGSEKTLVEEAMDTFRKAESAFAGDPSIFAKFWLYDWSDANGGEFVLVRKAFARDA